MDDNLKAIQRAQAETAIKRLKDHSFETSWFETKEEALQYLKESILHGSSIGVGGSMTLEEMGVIAWLTGNPDYAFLDRYHTDDREKIFHESMNADVYLMSSNAVTLDGCLYNVDGTGNRVAALIYGPKKVYVLCGTNKLVNDVDSAVKRVKEIAAPANNVRLHKDNPCATLGSCMNCMRPTTICNQFVLTRRSGTPNRIHVILINESLGY
ncbi:MAG: lactate utilization protein [Solobacterium sp.]|jgi:hypothetical protein|nr:lactate utilization protein [Solobacterium sp.]MCH4266668.1 lactate utilization protein [Solobacterium sp.]